jgi:hypothetical protein
MRIRVIDDTSWSTFIWSWSNILGMNSRGKCEPSGFALQVVEVAPSDQFFVRLWIRFNNEMHLLGLSSLPHGFSASLTHPPFTTGNLRDYVRY